MGHHQQVQGDFREQIGWRELVQEVAKIRDSLAPEEKAHLGIIGTNYGEAGAVTSTVLNTVCRAQSVA